MANHGPSYGLSRELERKVSQLLTISIFWFLMQKLQNQARFCIEEAQEVLQWIQDVTKIQFDKDPRDFQSADEVSESLKDGVILCMYVLQIF